MGLQTLRLSHFYAAPLHKQNFPAFHYGAALLPLSAVKGELLRVRKQTELIVKVKTQQLSYLTETMAVSKIRINFHPNSEAMINKQINMELHASYVYMSMAAFFDRDDVALAGFAKRFRENSDEERDHAMKFIEYQNKRGGRVVFQDVAKAKTDDWGSAMAALEAQFELEKSVHEALLELHQVAEKNNDSQLTDFLEGEFLKEQVEAQKEIGDLITKLKRAGDSLGLHIIDKELQG